MNWTDLYPSLNSSSISSTASPADIDPRHVTVADIGCGFGGLLVSLSPKLTGQYILGMPLASVC